MSENKLSKQTGTAVQAPSTDISEADMKKVQEYIVAGLPGISAVNDTVLYRMLDLYLSGSTYWQISNCTNIKRTVVLYLSHNFNWYMAKREYLAELDRQIKGRVIDAKLVSQDFLLQLTQMFEKKIGQKIKRYMATDDSSHADEINLKEIDKYIKSLETLKSLGEDGRDSKGRPPAVGLNLGDGVTIEKTGDNKVTITPNAKEKTIGDMLAQFANARREEENNARPTKKSDRETSEAINEKGESGNENE